MSLTRHVASGVRRRIGGTDLGNIALLSSAVILLVAGSAIAQSGNRPLPLLDSMQTDSGSGRELAVPSVPPLGQNTATVRIRKQPNAAAQTVPQRLPAPPAEGSAATVRVTKTPGNGPAVVTIRKDQSSAPAVLRVRDDSRTSGQAKPVGNNTLPNLGGNRGSVIERVKPQFAGIAGPRNQHGNNGSLLDVDRAFTANESALSRAQPTELGAEAIRLLQDSGESTTASQPRELNEDDRFGQAPADADNSQVFLRTETVLLGEGEAAFDFGIRYVWREFEFPVVLPGNILAEQRIRTRQLFMPFQVRYGVKENAQVFLDVPVGLSHFETSSFASDFFTSKFGLGDISGGLSYQLHSETDDRPAVILTTSFVAPTGDDPFALTTVGFSDSSSLGSGFWGAGASVLFTKTYDPMVVFGGFGYLHRFDRSYIGIDFDPGHVVTYQFGAGFAVNSVMTISAAFFGAFETTTKANGISISNSSQEPFSIRLALTHVRNPCCIIEPFISFGLNQDAPNADFGIVLTRR